MSKKTKKKYAGQKQLVLASGRDGMHGRAFIIIMDILWIYTTTRTRGEQAAVRYKRRGQWEWRGGETRHWDMGGDDKL